MLLTSPEAVATNQGVRRPPNQAVFYKNRHTEWNVKKYLLMGGCLLLGACSSSHDGGSGSKDKEVFKKAYSITINGCATGEQVFTSEISESDAVEKLCAGLADAKRNNGCAEIERRNVFDVTCRGKDWFALKARATETPAAAAPAPTPAPRPAPMPRLDVRPTLNIAPGRLLAERVELAADLADVQRKSATELAAEMNSCGFNHFGPGCLAKVSYARSQVTSLAENLYASEFTYDDKVMTMILHTEPGPGPLKIVAVDVLLGNDKGLKLFTIKVAANRDEQLRKNLATPTDLRMLYHAANEAPDPQQVSAAYTQNKSLIIQSKDVAYQQQILPSLRGKVANEVVLEISEGLLVSSSENVRQLAAINVLNVQPTRADLKPLVLAATKSPVWSIRLAAAETLAKIPLNTGETNSLIGMIGDNDSDVAAAARKGIAGVKIGPENLGAAQALSTESGYLTRIAAVGILGRIGTPDATRTVIKKLDDSDSDVFQAAKTTLVKLPLDASYVSDLKSVLKSGKYLTRIATIQALGRIEDESSTLMLIEAFRGENDGDVQQAIGRELDKRAMSAAAIDTLIGNYMHPNYTVRLQITKLLAKSQNPRADLALVQHQLHEKDTDVQQAIAKALLAHTLSEALVPNLERVFTSPSYTVRMTTAQLLGKIKTTEAKAALERQLAKETDNDVQRAIRSALGAS